MSLAGKGRCAASGEDNYNFNMQAQVAGSHVRGWHQASWYSFGALKLRDSTK
jgi:hypothetical protein